MKLILIVCSIFMLGQAVAAPIKGTQSNSSWNQVSSSSSYVKFKVESVKVGLFTSIIAGYVMKYNYSGELSKDGKSIESMKLEFDVLSMNTRQTDRDDKLHNQTINHKVGPKIEIQFLEKIEASAKSPATVKGKMKILGKLHPFSAQVLFNNDSGDSVEISGSATFSIKELIKLGVKDPSIIVAKVSDTINVSFKIIHNLK